MQKNRYHLTISRKTKFLNFFRSLFILISFDKILARLARNKPVDSFVAKLCPPNYLYKTGSVRNFTVNGISYSLDVSDTMGHANYFAIYDPAQMLLYKKIRE